MQVFQATGNDAHHALVKVFVIHTQGSGGLFFAVHQRLREQQRLFAHIALHGAALAVDGVELLRQSPRQFGVVGAQALDAQRHVGQAARGIDAWPNRKAHVLAAGLGGVPRGHFEQGRQTCGQLTFAHAQQTLRHQASVVGVQSHHIGYRTQCNQRQQAVELGFGFFAENTALTHQRSQGQQDIKHHTHTGHAFALETAARLVGVDQGMGRGQLAAWQMVVGDEHLQAQTFGFFHTAHAGDAVVHGDQDLCAAGVNPLGNVRGQTIAIDHAVGHDEAHVLRT